MDLLTNNSHLPLHALSWPPYILVDISHKSKNKITCIKIIQTNVLFLTSFWIGYNMKRTIIGPTMKAIQFMSIWNLIITNVIGVALERMCPSNTEITN